MIKINYYQNEVAGKVFVLHDSSSNLYTVWRIANTSCNGACKESRDVCTFKSMPQLLMYLGRLTVLDQPMIASTILTGTISLVSNDLIATEDGTYLFEGLATTVIDAFVASELGL